jgi:hypothetical protein
MELRELTARYDAGMIVSDRGINSGDSSPSLALARDKSKFITND